MNRTRKCGTIAALAAVLLASSCGDDRYAKLPAAARAGWEVYRVHCLLCHTDPLKESPTGPAIAGSSLELLRAKVLEGKYPPGYQPKRPGPITMPVNLQVKDQLELLAAFLGAVN